MSTKAQAIQFAQRAMMRSAAVVRRQMSQGLSSLATIVALAPFFGVLGTLIGIPNSFPGFAGQMWYVRATILERLSEACMWTALGLLVAFPTFWFYKYLTARVERFDLEMEAVSIEIANLLALRPMYFAPASGPIAVPQPPIFHDHIGDELHDIPRPWYRSSPAASVMILASWCIHTARYFSDEATSTISAPIWAAAYVAITFAISWFVAYPVWIKILRRSPGGLASLASFACLCWSLTELWFGAHLW
jgi:hypothetical protein